MRIKVVASYVVLALLLVMLLGTAVLANPRPTFGFHGLPFGAPYTRVVAQLRQGCTVRTAENGVFMFTCPHWLGQPTLFMPLQKAGRYVGAVVGVPGVRDPIPAYELLRQRLQQELGAEGLERCITHTNDDLTDVLPERAWQLNRVRAGQAMMVTHWVDEQENQVMLRTEFHPPNSFWVNVLFLASDRYLGLESPPPTTNIGF